MGNDVDVLFSVVSALIGDKHELTELTKGMLGGELGSFSPPFI